MKKNLTKREKVLDLLYKAKGQYISGEELSNKLGVSRTSIWKYIKYLREAGYKIESSSKVGYRLVTSSDKLIPEEIKRNLKTDFIGQNIIYYDEVDSTSRVAKEKAQKGDKEGTMVIAEKQSVGKGRLGRDFSSPQGGLWLSIILRPDLKPMQATRLTYIASLAIAETINKLTKLDARIKWPNDILIGDKKVCGILTEMGGELDRIDHLVVGIGINANFSIEKLDKSLHNKVTTLYNELEEKVDRVEFINLLLENLESLYKKVDSFEELLAKWKECSYTINQEVEVDNGRDTFRGKAVDIGEDGALIIQIGSQLKKFYSGEVSLVHKEFTSGN
ncbi:biotin--[acetyl-CoA-carboxylase] ligase [Halonatronum saccharophilum]|uniref:biotin--[acetyl-CoA-carboxylase] ligase n=1 Tax=Halonatronum saccharophilum TaxID=150060 RepID=UPI0004835B5B|nr:biotin--[acetyl-CoA-carboxylase] ligase [Halonatronum saccharophilum]